MDQEAEPTFFRLLLKHEKGILWGHGDGEPWLGFYTPPSSTEPRDCTLKDSWKKHPSTVSDIGGCYVFAPSEPSDVPRFVAGLAKLLELPAPRGRYVLWIENPANIGLSDLHAVPHVAFYAPLSEADTRGEVASLASITLEDVLRVEVAEHTIIELEPDDEFAFKQSENGIRLKHVGGTVAEYGTVDDGGMQLPLDGEGCGRMLFGGTFAPGVKRFPPTLTYSLTFAQDAEASHRNESPRLEFPLLNAEGAPSALEGRSFQARLDLFGPYDPASTHFELAPDGSLPSALRTVFGKQVLLAPLERSSRLVLNRAVGGAHLTADGKFSIRTASEEDSSDRKQLLCGLSGVEHIEFGDGDTIRFVSGRPATVRVRFPNGSSEPDAAAFVLEDDEGGRTAWVSIEPAASDGGRAYFAEPDLSPFFARVDSEEDPRALDYFPLERGILPVSDFDGLPLVPYAEYRCDESGGSSVSDPAFVRAFEFRLLNPERRRIMDVLPPSHDFDRHLHSNRNATSVTALTPQGHVAAFDDGKWRSLRIAHAQDGGDGTSTDLSFQAVAGQALSAPVQNAFLTNQQFLVISCNRQLVELHSHFVIDDWTFCLNIPETPSVGDYRNVLLFKSADSSIDLLAHHPELWTQRHEFCAESDPEGRFMSNWLVGYFDEARKMRDTGVDSLEDFCRIVEDPSWNGFLALKVDVDCESSELPPELQAIVGSIDPNLLFAHHLGSRANLVTSPQPPSQVYDIDSSVFGLIHYVDPVLGADPESIPPFVDFPGDFDFRVLSLEVEFRNSRLHRFANASLLLINELFGDAVTRYGPTTAEGEFPLGENRLILIGSFRKKDGVPVYSFTTADGDTVDFFLSSSAFERITAHAADMTALDDGSGHQTARFSLRGDLRFLGDNKKDPAKRFDLLSYDRLGFAELWFDMPVGSGDKASAITFNPAGIALNRSPNELSDASSALHHGNATNRIRVGSLLTQFPAAIKGLIAGTKDRLPDAMGYRALRTDVPDGIAPASLKNGPWYALHFDLSLGKQGGLAPELGISAELLLAWPSGKPRKSADCLPAFKLTGPQGVSLSFDLQGIIQCGASDVALNRAFDESTATGQFLLILEDIGLHFLKLSVPPKGTTNVCLFGDVDPAKPDGLVDPTLGWFGGYVAKKSSPSAAPTGGEVPS